MPVSARLRSLLSLALRGRDSADQLVEYLEGIETAAGAAISGFVYVDSVSDLPDESGGVRTLAANTVYVFRTTIDLGTARLVTSGNTVLRGVGGVNPIYIKTANASPLLTSNATGCLYVTGIKFWNTSGKCIAYTGVSGAFCRIDDCIFLNESALADTFVGGSANLRINDCRWDQSPGGPAISGAWADLVLTDLSFSSMGSTATFISIASGTTAATIVIEGCILITTAAGQTALSIDSAILPTNDGVVLGCIIGGSGTLLSGVTEGTYGWDFRANQGIEESTAVGRESFDGNATETVVSATDTFYSITTDTAWSADAANERFVIASSERLHYDGQEPGRFIAHIDLTLEAASINQTMQARLRKYDSSADTTSTVGVPFTFEYRSTARSVSRELLVELEEDDEVWIEISNTTSTANFTVISANLVVHPA